MARIVYDHGEKHSFPDEATDEQIAAALSGSDIGMKVGDKTRMTDAQLLNLLKSQRTDPARDPSFTSQLESEIARVEKRMGVAPRGTQAEARKVEPVAPAGSPMDIQRENEDRFEAARQVYLKANGVLPRGKTQARSIEEMSGIQDPAKTRDAAEQAEVADTGNLTLGDSGLYQIAKPVAAIAGFSKGGPAAATGAETLVRATSLAYNLTKAVNSGAMSEDDAYARFVKEIGKGAGEDALFNFGIPLLGNIASRIPGAKWLGDRVAALAVKGGQALGLPVGGAPAAIAAPSARDVKLADRAALTDDPAKKQAIAELGARMPNDKVMTPGQVTDMPGVWESNVRKGQPRAFDVLDREMEGAADGMLRDTTMPAFQPSAQTLGQQIQATAEATQKKVKERLRPAFEAADQLGVKVDLTEVRQAVSKALFADSKVPGGKLAPSEREQLQAIFDALRLNPKVGAEEALDFISRRKEQLRATTADWKPSGAYDKTIGDLTNLADTAYARAAGSAGKFTADELAEIVNKGAMPIELQKAINSFRMQNRDMRAVSPEELLAEVNKFRNGKSDVVKNLLAAQRDYKEMMGTVYDDAIKAALKKNPEDVGRFLWTGGNVSEPQQLQKLFGIAQREGALKPHEAEQLSRAVTRGFLQEAVPNIEAASKWSQTLKENPAKRRTWEELTSTPGGQQLRDTMEVIEKAAQMAMNKNIVMSGGTGLAQRASSGAGGVTASKVHPGMLGASLSYLVGMKAAATAYTHGDKGVLNAISQVLRADMHGLAGTKAAQAAAAKVAQFVHDNGITEETE